MEESISNLCRTLASFCKHLHSTSQAIKDSIDRRPIPLDSASSTFIQCLNRRVSSASADLNLLESMVLGTVSFEELLGHCNEVYKKNQIDLSELEERLESLGYVPPDVEMNDEDEVSELATPVGIDKKFSSRGIKLDSPSFACGLDRNKLEEDPLFDDSMCIQNLGLSDVCLATLASEDNYELASPKMSSHNSMSNDNDKSSEKGKRYPPSYEDFGEAEATSHCLFGSSNDLKASGLAAKTILKIFEDDYDKLPPYLKTVASWEDLESAVAKMNSILNKKEKSKEGYSLTQEDIAALEYGSKGRSYLLVLLRMNRLLVETVNGSIIYSVVDETHK